MRGTTDSRFLKLAVSSRSLWMLALPDAIGSTRRKVKSGLMSAILSRNGVEVTAQLKRREMRLAVSLVGP